MDTELQYSRARVATRLAFLVGGFTMACWAPLVPFAKERIGASDGELGTILLSLGVGSLVAMPVTGLLCSRMGSKPMIVAGGLGLVILLPFLALSESTWALSLTLLGFGASLGTLDVAMNIHAVEVEKQSKRLLMSGFHALYSVGGFLGAGGMALLLSAGLGPVTSTIGCSALSLVAVLVGWPWLIGSRGEPAKLAWPHGIVILMAFLAAISFLVEGAILDWGALLIIETDLASPDKGGLGYSLFSITMTIGRLTGDRLVSRIGDRRTLILGGVTTIAGIAMLLAAPVNAVAICGFLVIGLGASNIVPVLFRLTGNQKVMPPSLAVAALTTCGYAGILCGPALIGFVAEASNLRTAFWILAALMLCVPVLAGRCTRG